VAAKKAERGGAGDVIALDTSCIIALLCGWHEHHRATLALVDRRLDGGATIALAAPALIEAYAVLTRLPAPHRLAPADAAALLRENFREQGRAVALSPGDYWSLLDTAPAEGIYGGRTYDAVIAACARKAGAREILSLNARHFDPFADDALRVTSPI
jgi:predicted nucleic acid-binding protein